MGTVNSIHAFFCLYFLAFDFAHLLLSFSCTFFLKGLLKTDGGIQVGGKLNDPRSEATNPQITSPKAVIGKDGLAVLGGSLTLVDGEIQVLGSGGIFVENGTSSLKTNGPSSTLSLSRNISSSQNSNATILIEQSFEKEHVYASHLEARTDGRTVLEVRARNWERAHPTNSKLDSQKFLGKFYKF